MFNFDQSEEQMKKVLISIFILSFLISSFVFAQDNLKVTAQVRPRAQLSNKDFNSDVASNSFTELRTRVGLQLTPIENLGCFIQLQDSRVYGSEHNTMTDTKNIDLHQAYFSIKKLFDLPLDLKVGRMELSYGSQRLIGAVGWHNVGRSFDGGVLTLNTKKMKIDFIQARLDESGLPGDSLDNCLYAAYGNVKTSKNLKLQPFVISEMKKDADFSRYTLGVYLAGKLGALSHEIEAAYQMGSMSEDVDIAAYMFTANLNYKLNAKYNPVIGAGVDYLSGDDGEDESKYKVFNTLYATNHKFYGFMDYFLNLPVHTYGKGLMDMQGKLAVKPCEKFGLAAAFHLFSSTADYTLMDGSTSTNFGSEIDLTLSYAYNKLVKFQGGFSLFTPGEIFKDKKGEDSSTWAYFMAIVNL